MTSLTHWMMIIERYYSFRVQILPKSIHIHIQSCYKFFAIEAILVFA